MVFFLLRRNFNALYILYLFYFKANTIFRIHKIASLSQKLYEAIAVAKR